MPIFSQKNVHPLNNTMLSCPYYIKKTSILEKTLCSHVFLKNSLLSCQYLVTKTSILSKVHNIMWPESNVIPFFFRFLQKHDYSHVHSLSEIVHSLKIRCSYAHILLQKRPFSQKHYPPRSFFSNLS